MELVKFVFNQNNIDVVNKRSREIIDGINKCFSEHTNLKMENIAHKNTAMYLAKDEFKKAKALNIQENIGTPKLIENLLNKFMPDTILMKTDNIEVENTVMKYIEKEKVKFSAIFAGQKDNTFIDVRFLPRIKKAYNNDLYLYIEGIKQNQIKDTFEFISLPKSDYKIIE